MLSGNSGMACSSSSSTSSNIFSTQSSNRVWSLGTRSNLRISSEGLMAMVLRSSCSLSLSESGTRRFGKGTGSKSSNTNISEESQEDRDAEGTTGWATEDFAIDSYNSNFLAIFSANNRSLRLFSHSLSIFIFRVIFSRQSTISRSTLCETLKRIASESS